MSQRLSPVCQKRLARRSFLTRLSCLNRGIAEVPFKQIQHASLVFLLCQSCLKKVPKIDCAASQKSSDIKNAALF